jgi:hypothetical protein
MEQKTLILEVRFFKTNASIEPVRDWIKEDLALAKNRPQELRSEHDK